MGCEKAISVKVYPHPSFQSSISVYVLPARLFSTNVQNLLLLLAQYKMCYIKKCSVLIVLHWLNVTTKLFLIFSGYFLHIYFAVVPNKYKFRKIIRKINIENEKTVLGLTLHLSCSLSVCFQCASDNQYYLLYHYLMIIIIMINMIINKYFFLQQTVFIVFYF